MAVAAYPIFVTVQNPVSQPERNYWAIELFEPGDDTARMAESWVAGFEIQEVQEVELLAYNAANAFPGEGEE